MVQEATAKIWEYLLYWQKSSGIIVFMLAKNMCHDCLDLYDSKRGVRNFLLQNSHTYLVYILQWSNLCQVVEFKVLLKTEMIAWMKNDPSWGDHEFDLQDWSNYKEKIWLLFVSSSNLKITVFFLFLIKYSMNN